MKCTHCNADNSAGAKFCRECGRPLPTDDSGTIISKYPEYNFLPTSLQKCKGRPSMWLAVILLSLCSIFAFIFGFVVFIDSGIRYEEIGGYLVGGLGFVLGLYLIYMTIKCWKLTRPVDVSAIADYIEKSPKVSRYPIVVKDGRFGILNARTHKLQLPCKYQYITWKSSVGILTVTADGKKYDIDINGKVLN